MAIQSSPPIEGRGLAERPCSKQKEREALVVRYGSDHGRPTALIAELLGARLLATFGEPVTA